MASRDADGAPRSEQFHLIRAVGGGGVLQLAGMGLTFLVGIQLARGLGPAGYGRYGIALAILTLMGMVGALGIPKLVTREVAASLAEDDRATMYGVLRWADRACTAASAIAGIATLLIAAAIAVRSKELGLAILVGIPTIPLLAFAGVRSGAIQGLHHVVRGQVPTFLVRPLASSILLFALFWLMPHANSYDAMAVNVASAGLTLAAATTLLRNLMPRPKPGKFTDRGRAWLRSSVPMAVTDGLQILQSQLSVLLLGALALPAEVGLFRIGLSIWVVVAVPSTLVAISVGPTLARLHRQSRDRLQLVVTHSAWLQLLGAILIAAPLLMFPRGLLGLVFGSEYAAAAPSLVILLAGQIVNGAFGVNAQLLNMTGHERRLTEATIWGVAVNAVATCALIPNLGAVGAAIGMTLSVLTWNVITWMQCRRLLHIDTSVFPLRVRVNHP